MKAIIDRATSAPAHWVGDGFPVRSLFSYGTHAKSMSPFLLLDYAGPHEFAPARQPRGVGRHPHRGFETVTIVYEGEVAHKDSTGNGGVIGPGDVQWMTAGAGILHEEFHSPAFTESGGRLEMVQLWVNLPSKDKMTRPGYQGITREQIPSVALPAEAGQVRVIAGRYGETSGPARTFSPMNVWDVRLKASANTTLKLPEGWNTGVVVLHGTVQVNGREVARDADLVVLAQNGTDLHLEANTDAVLLLLNGEPIEEPIVGHGPFVMNTTEEIQQAIQDFRSGNFGELAD